MQWTDANGQKHHDMGTCHCGEHHAFDEINALREENQRLADTLREIADAGCESVRDDLTECAMPPAITRDSWCWPCIARAALDRHTKDTP